MKEQTWRVMLALFLLVAIILFAVLSKKVLVGKAIEEVDVDKVYEKEYIVENCKCIERKIFYCSLDGFEYVDGLCRNNNAVTNPTVKCSKYDCNGYIVEVNSSFYE